MQTPTPKQLALLAPMATHVLEHGLTTASLRPLAAAADTSDRMLIYHFGTKEQLIDMLLLHLASDLMQLLTSGLPPGRAPSRRACLRDIITLMRQPQAEGYMRIWFDILSKSTEGPSSHRAVASDIMAAFEDWLLTRLPAHDGANRPLARALLTLIEGGLVMDAAGRDDVFDDALHQLVGDL